MQTTKGELMHLHNLNTALFHSQNYNKLTFLDETTF